MNTPRLSRRILTGTILSLLVIAPEAARAEALSTTLDAPSGGGTANYNWTTLTWSIPAEYPGLDDLNDDATILFREFNNVDGGGTAIVQVDLEGGTYTLGSLTLNESGAGETAGMLQNGTLNVSSISQVSAGNVVTFTSTTIIASGATPLSLTQSADFRSMVFRGAVTGTGGVLANMTTSAGRLIFDQAIYNVSGALTMSGIGNLRFDTFSENVVKTIDSLTFNGTGEIEVDRSSGSAAFGLAVSGAVNVNSSRIRFRSEDANGEFTLNGPVTLDNNGAGVEFATNNQRLTVRVQSALNDSGEGDTLRLAPHLITSSNSSNFGTIVIGAGVTTNRTGPTDFFTTGVLGDNFRSIGGKVVLNAVSAAGTGLGPGQINVGNDISVGNHLNVVANHGAALDVDLKAFNVISGDLTGAVYAAAPTAADEVAIGAGDRIFVNGTLGLPTTAMTGGATHYLGIPANTGTFTVGDDANPLTTDDIFRGVAFGASITTAIGGAFSGTVNTFSGAADLPVYVLAQIFGQSGTATFETTGAVTFTGPGVMILDEPNAGGTTRAVNLPTINRVGSVESQNNNIVILSDASALNTGQTLNISFGRTDLNNIAAVEAGSTVVIGESATLSLDQAVTTGTFTIGQGGTLQLLGIANTESGATFNITGTSASILLNAEGAVGTQLAALMPQADIILAGVFGVDAFTGAGIRLGPGKRLTLASQTDTSALTLGVGITTTAVAGETVYISAPVGRTLDLNDSITLGAADVEIGSATPLSTVLAQGNVSRSLIAHTGVVNFDGNSTARNVTVNAGTLSFSGAGSAGSATFSGALTFNSGTLGFVSDDSPAELSLIGGTLAANGVRINDGARFEFEFDQQVGGVSVQQVFTFNGNAANSPSTVQLIVDEEGTVAAGGENAFFTINQLHLTNGTVFAADEQSTVTFRAGLRLAGNATVLDNATGEDFELLTVTGIDASGAVDNVGAKTLFVGDGVATGEVFNTILFGALAPNITAQLNNGAITLPTGAVVDGKITFVGRTGTDSDVLITAGQTGAGYLTGSGHIDVALGEDVEAFVNELDAGDPPNGALVPLENVVNLRINVLPGETGIVRGNRGINAPDATDVFGAVTFSDVHLAQGSALSVAVSNTVATRASVALDGDATISGTDGTRSYLSSVTDPGAPNTLTVGPNVRLVGPVSAGTVVVGGGIAATLNIHQSDAQTQVLTTTNGSATYPLLPGMTSVPSLNLSDALVIGLGGVVNIGIDNLATDSFSISTGVRLSDNGDLNLFAPLTVPVGKRFEGASTNTVFMDDGSAADTGAVTIAGTLAPGSIAVPAGTITFQDGFLTLADGAAYEFQAGIDAASSDLTRLTGTSSSLIFAGSWTLQLGATSSFDPTGLNFTLFDAASTISGLGTPTIVNNVPGWDTSTATITIVGNDVILGGVMIPEPGSAGMLLAGLATLVGQHRRRQRA